MRDNYTFRCASIRALSHVIILLAVLVLLLSGCSSFLQSHTCSLDQRAGRRPAGSRRRRSRGAFGPASGGITDRGGRFVIRAVPTNDRLAVTFSAPKFMSTTRIYEAPTCPAASTQW